MKTEEQFANEMMALAHEARETVGKEKTAGFLTGILIGEVLKAGGNLADVHAIIDATWKALQDARKAGG